MLQISVLLTILYIYIIKSDMIESGRFIPGFIRSEYE